jgi:hypothetical protein
MSIGTVIGVEYPQTSEVRSGEFVFNAPTVVDAMMAGERHVLAREALEDANAHPHAYVVVGDRIEPQPANTQSASEMIADLAHVLDAVGYNVWREGLALVVLSKRGPGTEPASAWVSAVER